MTFCPEAARRAAMPRPMAPTPRKATWVMGLLRFLEDQQELVGVAADRRVEHLHGAVVGWIAQNVALARQHEADAFHFLLHRVLVDAMQGVSRGRHVRAGFGGVILDEELAAGLQRRVDAS